MNRRKTRQVKIGNVKIGAGAPVSIQSMTKTDTKDVKATTKQIERLQNLGCEIIRVAVRDSNSCRAIERIKPKINIPLVADIHFNYKLALEAAAAGCDCIRINPGNMKKREHILQVIRDCRKRKLPIRIGVNSGSSGTQTAEGLVRLAKNTLNIFEKEKFYDIIISLKASDVCTTIEAYRKMAKVCDYPFELGVTATGAGHSAIVKSAIGIGALLAEGIGDTIRVSLTAEPEEEVAVAKHILQALDLRKFYPEIISCPICGRSQVNLQKIADEFQCKLSTLNPKFLTVQSFPKIALMGCEVNGPGEAMAADIGIAFGKDSGILFKKGKIIKKIKAKDAAKELLRLLK